MGLWFSFELQCLEFMLSSSYHEPELHNSATGPRTRVARVRAEYPNQLDYSGFAVPLLTLDSCILGQQTMYS